MIAFTQKGQNLCRGRVMVGKIFYFQTITKGEVIIRGKAEADF